MAKQSFCGACAILMLTTVAATTASSAVPSGTWMFANRVALRIFDCSGLLCGKIVWLLRPDNPAGQPDLDDRNPDPALRQRHLCGLTIIWGMQASGQDYSGQSSELTREDIIEEVCVPSGNMAF